jgi:hypothetical protein
VNDAATGKPTPVRVRFTGPHQEYLAPFGRLTRFATDPGQCVGGNLLLDGREFAYIDGSCEINLPADPITVEITKGPEYKPVRQEVRLGPGKLALRFAMERWIDPRREGWYSGDARAHFLTPHAAVLEGAAEDLAVVNLLAMQTDLAGGGDSEAASALPNIEAFSGQRPAAEAPGHVVVVNTYNTHPVLGKLALLNCHRVVYPLRFGYGPQPDNWTLADWCDQCHRKGGLVVWSDFELTFREKENIAAPSEALADLILGKVDALEVTRLDWCRDGHDAWYAVLNSGLRAPLVGASGKEANNTLLGAVRTYTRLHTGEEFSYATWIEAVRAGRTYVSNGPLLFFTVNGQDPGAVITASSFANTVHIRAEVKSLSPLKRLEILIDGRVIAHAAPRPSKTEGVLHSEIIDGDFPVPASGWLAARCWGDHGIAAHTSPVYLRAENQRAHADATSLAKLVSSLEAGLTWVNEKARLEKQGQRERSVSVFESARTLLRGTPV